MTTKTATASSATTAHSANRTAVLYVHPGRAKITKTRLEYASMLDRRFRMAPAEAAASDYSVGGAPCLDVRCIAIPVTEPCLEIYRECCCEDRERSEGGNVVGEHSSPSPPTGGEDLLPWAEHVLSAGRQPCLHSTSVLGNHRQQLHASTFPAGGDPLKGDAVDSSPPLTIVQHALAGVLANAHREDERCEDLLSDASVDGASDEPPGSTERRAEISRAMQSLSAATCPKKLEVLGSDDRHRTVVVPSKAFRLWPRVEDCDGREREKIHAGTERGRAGHNDGAREFLDLLRRFCLVSPAGVDVDGARMDEAAARARRSRVQMQLWKRLARAHGCSRVVRRGDVDPECGKRESGHRILWPRPPAPGGLRGEGGGSGHNGAAVEGGENDGEDGDWNRGFLPCRSGPDSPGWISVTEHRIRQSFDLSRVMFSRGNVTEKLRFGLMCASRGGAERVLDMYAGIGYYTLPALIIGKASHVTACEWNPNALLSLRYNLKDNGVNPSKFTVLEGDCRVSLRKMLEEKGENFVGYDRISLGLLPSSEGGWSVAVACLSRDNGGWLHVHANVPTAERRSWVLWLVHCLSVVADRGLGRRDWSAVCVRAVKVKSFAPRVDHVVADVFMGPSRALPSSVRRTMAEAKGGKEDGREEGVGVGVWIGALDETSGTFEHAPAEMDPPSCALSRDGILHQYWLMEPS